MLYGQKVEVTYNNKAYVIEGLPETVDVTLIGKKQNVYLAKQYPAERVNVDLKDRSYPIVIQRGLLNNLDKYLTGRIFVITNTTVFKLYGEKLKSPYISAVLKPTAFIMRFNSIAE